VPLPQPLGYYCTEASTFPQTCSKGSYGPNTRVTDAAFCSACLPRQSSTPGSASCTLCVESYYKVEETNSTSRGSFDCKECLSGGAVCVEGTTLATVELLPGRWRLSGASEEVVRCFTSSPTVAGNSSDLDVVDGSWWSPCKGGVEPGFEGQGYCENGYTGPRVSSLCVYCVFLDHADPSQR
jgi:hypothetical protein